MGKGYVGPDTEEGTFYLYFMPQSLPEVTCDAGGEREYKEASRGKRVVNRVQDEGRRWATQSPEQRLVPIESHFSFCGLTVLYVI